VILASLLAGMAGYAYFESMSLLDSFDNAAMILSGMGPLTPLRTDGGRIFAGVYALYSGVVLLFAMGLIMAPILHRVLHHFHLSDEAANYPTRHGRGIPPRRARARKPAPAKETVAAEG